MSVLGKDFIICLDVTRSLAVLKLKKATFLIFNNKGLNEMVKRYKWIN